MDAPLDVIGRVSSVLRAVSTTEPTGCTTSAVARTTGLARPTAHRLLMSLQRDGFLDRGTDGCWLLGPELYLLSTAAAPRYDVTSTARPFVRKLAQASGESAFFSVRRGEETVCLLREDGSFPIRSHVLYEGIRLPLGVASAGLAVLAHLSDDEVDAFLARNPLSEQFGVDHEADCVRARVAETRQTGWSLNPGLIVTGSWGMGAAVFDRDGRPVSALSLTGVEHRFAAERRAELGTLLLQAAHALSQALFRTPGLGG